MKGKQFQNTEDARAFIEGIIEGIILDIPHGPVNMVGCHDSWFEKMVKCVQIEGCVLEKLELTERL